MGLTTLAVLVFGVATWMAWRIGALRLVPGLCAALLGFFLADSGIAPAVTDAVGAVFDWVATWRI